jgi:hypothetical protein
VFLVDALEVEGLAALAREVGHALAKVPARAVLVVAVELGKPLLQHRHPDFRLVLTFAKTNLAPLHRHKVVHRHHAPRPVLVELDLEETKFRSRTDKERKEQIVACGHHAGGAQPPAVAQLALHNVAARDAVHKNVHLVAHLRQPLPLVAVQRPVAPEERRRVGSKVWIGPWTEASQTKRDPAVSDTHHLVFLVLHSWMMRSSIALASRSEHDRRSMSSPLCRKNRR